MGSTSTSTSTSTLAAVILWSVVSHIAVSAEGPSGIPDDAQYVKVDRVTDGDTWKPFLKL